jgi:AraC-like DNA-binding protein
MLATTTETRIGAAGVRTTLVLEREVRGTVILRDRLAYDTRFAAAASGKPEAVGHLFLLPAGRFVIGGEAHAAPVAFVLADEEMERPRPGVQTFRTDGERVHVIQLRFARATVRAPIGLAAGLLRLPDACWNAAAELVAGAPRGDAPSLLGLLDALGAAGAIAPGLAQTACPEEPERFRRLWAALEPLYATYGGSASIKQIAGSLGMSIRQVGRDAKDLAKTFGFTGGYRDSLLVLRLRLAALLLSAPEATVADVARLAGYGSPIAMARAFRDAKLPAPTVIQDELRQGM